LGHGENSVFNIEQEPKLVLEYQKEKDITHKLIFDFRRLEYAFKQLTDIIFLRPINMCPDGIKFTGNTNNVLGTKKISWIWHCDTTLDCL